MWYVNQNFVGMGIIPEPVECLDRLVQGQKREAMETILVVALSRYHGIDELQAAKFASQLATCEEIADNCWRFLKNEHRGGNAEVLELITTCADEA